MHYSRIQLDIEPLSIESQGGHRIFGFDTIPRSTRKFPQVREPSRVHDANQSREVSHKCPNFPVILETSQKFLQRPRSSRNFSKILRIRNQFSERRRTSRRSSEFQTSSRQQISKLPSIGCENFSAILKTFQDSRYPGKFRELLECHLSLVLGTF